MKKKAYLHKAFKGQDVQTIINAIFEAKNALAAENNTSDDDMTLRQALEEKKAAVEKKILSKERTLKSTLTYPMTILATAVLGITRQPEYQHGQIAAVVSNDTFDQFHNTPVIGEKLTPELLQHITHATGMAFLGISLYVSKRIGYSFQLIALFNRILLANINLLITVGDKTNKFLLPIFTKMAELNQGGPYLPFINSFQKAFNFDELGLIEKEHAICLTTGFMIQTVFTWGYWPAMLGYIAAVTAAEMMVSIINQHSRQVNLSAANAIALQVLAHTVTYSYVYLYIYSFAALPEESSNDIQMPKDRAYEMLGLSQDASRKETQYTFRNLTRAVLFSCVADCQERLTEINTAYAVLKEGWQYKSD